jgi:hypothetical protein
MFELIPGCKLNKGCNVHISFEEGLVTKRILEVPESHDAIPRNIIIILFSHRVETRITLFNEGYDMEQPLLLNLVERLAVLLTKGVIAADGSRNLPLCAPDRDTAEYHLGFKGKHLYLIL